MKIKWMCTRHTLSLDTSAFKNISISANMVAENVKGLAVGTVLTSRKV
jgi:hypothetical protein